jgi:predicted metal-binding membrane protein
MAKTIFEAVLRRDRVIVAGALILLIVLAWGYVLWLVDVMRMGGMEMPGMRMVANPLGAAMIPALQPWSVTEFALMFVMWTIMMFGMMVPSAAPMILIYVRVGREAEKKSKALAGTAYFVAGYLLAWTAFSLIATTGQWMLERASLLTPMMASKSTIVGGIVLVAAGVFQWMPLKDICLNHCQAPLMFIQRHGGFRRQPLGSLRIGLHHGLYCIGCCWALMALLFVGGIMNVLWIAGIAILVLAEKVIPLGNILSRVAGVGFIAAGVWLLGSSKF